MSETEWKAESPDNKGSQVEIPDVLPLLPIRDIVIYPYMMLPLFVGRDARSIHGVVDSELDFSGLANQFRGGKSQSRRRSPRRYHRLDHAHAQIGRRAG